MILEQLVAAAKAGTVAERDDIIRALADAAKQNPEVYEDLLAMLVHEKWLSDYTTLVMRTIGYPRNTSAIAALVYYVCDANTPAAPFALEALQEIPAHEVVPYMIELLWDRGATNDWWSKDVHGLAHALTQLGPEYALPCVPVVAYLLADRGTRAKISIPELLWFIEAVGPDHAHVALPALLDMIEHEGENDVRTHARRLVESLNAHTLALYARIMPPAGP